MSYFNSLKFFLSLFFFSIGGENDFLTWERKKDERKEKMGINEREKITIVFFSFRENFYDFKKKER